jgi:hypothetical protein
MEDSAAARLLSRGIALTCVAAAATAAHRLITPNFPASWENTGNFAYFACWEQQRVQNIGRITVCYERIPGALEQGNFGSHQGIELGN